MRIRVLAHTDHLPTVATWLHAQWWAAEGHGRDATEAFLRAAIGPAAPMTLVAEQDGAPLGTATFDTDDLDSRPDLSPWLASVLVHPAHRRRGVATALVRAVEQAAAAAGHERLWLFTADQVPFYAARGWQAQGPAAYRGAAVTLMVRTLRAGAGASPGGAGHAIEVP